jgi:hypothetical protein
MLLSSQLMEVSAVAAVDRGQKRKLVLPSSLVFYWAQRGFDWRTYATRASWRLL